MLLPDGPVTIVRLSVARDDVLKHVLLKAASDAELALAKFQFVSIVSPIPFIHILPLVDLQHYELSR